MGEYDPYRLGGAGRLRRGFGPRMAPEDAFDLGVPFQGRIDQD